MDIISLGHSSFRIKGKTQVLVTDPYNSEYTGLKFPKHIQADIITISHSHEDHNDTSLIEGKPFIVEGAGEYEINGVSIIGISTFHDDVKGEKRGRNNIYRIKIDDVVFAHLGDLGHKLNSNDLEELDSVDVLFIPVGGIYTIDAKQAAEIVNDIEPKIVIPMHYKTKDYTNDKFNNITGVEDFLKEMGVETPQKTTKYTIGKTLPETIEVVIFE